MKRALIGICVTLLFILVLGTDSLIGRSVPAPDFRAVEPAHVLDMSDGEKETVLVDLADSRGFIGGAVRIKYDPHVHVYVCNLDSDPSAGPVVICYVRVLNSEGVWRAGTAVRSVSPDKLKAMGIAPGDPDVPAPDGMLMEPPTDDDSPHRSGT